MDLSDTDYLAAQTKMEWARLLRYDGLYQAAINNLRQALLFAERNDQRGLIYACMAQCYNSLRDPLAALETAQKAIDALKQCDLDSQPMLQKRLGVMRALERSINYKLEHPSLWYRVAKFFGRPTDHHFAV